MTAVSFAPGQSLVDYMVVAGLDAAHGLEPEDFADDACLELPPLSRPYKSHVLFHFPNERPWNMPFDPASILMLCFPTGLRLRPESRSRKICSHSFLVTKEDGSRMYGVALTFYEAIEDTKVLDALEVLQKMYLHQVQHMDSKTAADDASKSAAALSGTIYAPKIICLLSQVPAIATFERYLRQLYNVSQEPSDIPLEAYVSNLLYEVPVPEPGSCVQFWCQSAICTAIPAPQDLPMLEFSLRRLFNLFSVENILKIYSAVLLEEQVLLRSKDCELLMLVAEGITALLYPFSWMYVYVPILPATQRHFLEAPMPFVMGLPGDDDAEQAQETVLVEIDKGTVTSPDLCKLPNMEWYKQVLSALLKDNKHRSSGQANAFSSSEGLSKAEVLRKIASGEILPPSPNNPGSEEDFEFNAAVRKIFLSAFVDMFVDLDNYLVLPQPLPLPPHSSEPLRRSSSRQGVEHNEIGFDKAAFLSDQAEPHVPFLTRFLETQMFNTFLQSLADQSEPDFALPFRKLVKKRQRHDRGEHRPLNSIIGQKSTGKRRLSVQLDLSVTNDIDGSTAPKPRQPSSSPAADHPPPSVESPKPERKAHAGGARRSSFMVKRKRFRLNADYMRTITKDKTHEDISQFLLAIPEGSESARRDTQSSISLEDLHIDQGPIRRVSSDETRKRTHSNTGQLSKFGTSQLQFVTALLADCAEKAKKCILASFGSDTAESLGHTSAMGVLNAAVLNLAQVLERMWRHGLRKELRRKETMTSPLWSFLDEAVNRSTDRSEMYRDVRLVRGMTFLRTDAGKARAWVRLCLEKKTLAAALERFLKDRRLVRMRYRQYACISNEESRDYILQHLRTLTVANISCFTTNSAYQEALVCYHVDIMTAKGFRCGTTANIAFSLRGSLATVKPLQRPKGQNLAAGQTESFVFECQNLGAVTGAVVSHDGSGTSPTWTIQRVEITNLLTGALTVLGGGKVQKGENVLLTAKDLNESIDRGSIWSDQGDDLDMSTPVGRHSEIASPIISDECDEVHVQICENVAGAVNSIVRFGEFHKDKFVVEAQAQLLLGLKCVVPSEDCTAGEATQHGLSGAFGNVLKHGLKSNILFGGRKHPWYFIEKYIRDIKSRGSNTLSSGPENKLRQSVISINEMKLPKEASLGLLICYGASYKMLHVWFEHMAKSECAGQMYEDWAAIRASKRASQIQDFLRYLVESPFSLIDQLEFKGNPDDKNSGVWHINKSES
eukprot:m.40328 g.40328  ORF g.40328 m.40328 type:complete len:1231 (-) comp9654_c0_seq2:148-3840(-)